MDQLNLLISRTQGVLSPPWKEKKIKHPWTNSWIRPCKYYQLRISKISLFVRSPVICCCRTGFCTWTGGSTHGSHGFLDSSLPRLNPRGVFVPGSPGLISRIFSSHASRIWQRLRLSELGLVQSINRTGGFMR